MRSVLAIIALLVLVSVSTLSCDAPIQKEHEKAPDLVKSALVETNKYLRERHREQIKAFIARAGWEMKETPTGLWVEIFDPGTGVQVSEGKMVRYAYTTRLLNGTICYHADTTEPKSIVVGKGNIESGLEEGLRLLREGSKARFIMPPHLGHGNFGDMQKIPGAAVLIIEVEILSVMR